METYKVKNIEHKVYTVDDVPPNLEYSRDWKAADIGDWVETDDKHVIQILRKDKFTVGTCTGTYPTADNSIMDSVRKKDIYSVGGENWYTRLKNRTKATKNEIIFAKRVQRGGDPVETYIEVFNSKSKKNAKEK